jgi:hypothetical protein
MKFANVDLGRTLASFGNNWVAGRLVLTAVAFRFGSESNLHQPANCLRASLPKRVPKARYGALHVTIASGRVRLAMVGGAKIAR